MMKVLDFQSTPLKPLADTNAESSSPPGVKRAYFKGFDDDGRFLIMLEDSAEQILALSTIGMSYEDIGTDVAVAFLNNKATHPIIIGRIHHTKSKPPQSNSVLKIDGQRVTMQAQREIELRCGEASIVLTQAGKVLIKGNYVLTRSRGANKIKGAYVDIN